MAFAANDRQFRKKAGATKQTIPQMLWCQLLWKVLTEVRTQMNFEGQAGLFGSERRCSSRPRRAACSTSAPAA
jgi:hypothetical protein